MAEVRERAPIPQKKFVLIAHERGVDNYILADESGNLVECDGEALANYYMYHEVLISFKTLEKILLARGRVMEKAHFPRPDRVVDYVNQSVNKIIRGAVEKLDRPPKERIEFFSVPNRIVNRFDWLPRKR